MACFCGNREEFYGEVLLLDETKMTLTSERGIKVSKNFLFVFYFSVFYFLISDLFFRFMFSFYFFIKIKFIVIYPN